MPNYVQSRAFQNNAASWNNVRATMGPQAAPGLTPAPPPPQTPAPPPAPAPAPPPPPPPPPPAPTAGPASALGAMPGADGGAAGALMNLAMPQAPGEGWGQEETTPLAEGLGFGVNPAASRALAQLAAQRGGKVY